MNNTNDDEFEVKLQTILSLFSNEEEMIYTSQGGQLVQEQILAIEEIFHDSSFEITSNSSIIIDNLIELFIRILRRKLEDDSAIKINELLIYFVLYFQPTQSNPSSNFKTYCFNLQRKRPSYFNSIILNLSNNNSIRNLFILCENQHYFSQDVLEYYSNQNNNTELNIRIKCSIFLIFSKQLQRTDIRKVIKKTRYDDLLILSCFNEIEKSHEIILENNNDSLISQFIVIKYRLLCYHKPFSKKQEDDKNDEIDGCRLLIILCFRIISIYVVLLNDEEIVKYVKLSMKYLNNITINGFVKNEILNSLAKSSSSTVVKVLQVSLQNGLFEIIISYLNFILHDDEYRNNKQYFEYKLQNEDDDEYGKIVDNSLKFVICLMIKKSNLLFGGLMNLLDQFPNFNLFMRMLILEETEIAKTIYFENKPLYLEIIEYLISECMTDIKVLNEMMTPRYNLFLLLLYALENSGEYTHPDSQEEGFITEWEQFAREQAIYVYGICNLIDRFGFQNSIECAKFFPSIVEFKQIPKVAIIHESLFGVMRNYRKARMKTIQLTSFFLACGVRIQKDSFTQTIPSTIEFKFQEITTLISLATPLTIPRFHRKKSFLNSDLLRILRDMLCYDSMYDEHDET